MLDKDGSVREMRLYPDTKLRLCTGKSLAKDHFGATRSRPDSSLRALGYSELMPLTNSKAHFT